MTIHLHHKHILVTREKQAAAQFAEVIIASNGVAIQTPLLQINCMLLDKQIKNKLMTQQYEWIFFTSKNGVDCLFEQDMSLTDVKIAAVGPKTAKAVEDCGYEVAFVPSIFNAEVMAQEFLEMHNHSDEILLVRGTQASNILIDAFTKADLTFECVEIYKTRTNISEKANLQQKLRTEQLDFITFTSPSTIDAFISLTNHYPINPNTVIVCIGTTTENKAIDAGFSNIITPENFTIEGMLHTIHKHLQKER